MKISPSCIRDLLLTVESSCDLTNCFEYEKGNKPPSLMNYTHEQIIYHAIQCNDADLFKNFEINDPCTIFYIGDLTPKGHSLINELRDDTIWNKILKHGFNSVPDTILFIISLLNDKRKELM